MAIETNDQLKKARCLAKGWIWDEATKTCRSRQQVKETKQRAEAERKSYIPPTESRKKDPKSFLPDYKENPFEVTKPEPDPAQQPPTKIDPNTVPEGGHIIIDANGNERIQTKQEIEIEKAKGGQMSASEALQRQQILQAQQLAGQGLAGQVGQFNQLGVSPTGFDEGAIGGSVAGGIIPGLIRGVSSGIGMGILGAKAGGTIGAAAGPAGIAIVAGLGFASGIASSMLSEMKGQRTDNTNAQQRVLDEGKQILNDWVTFAEANPSLKAQALRGFNQQLQLIDQAHRQMKLDTSRDLLAFENAIPNLAEFDAFYSANGERDILANEMAIALAKVEPAEIKYVELASRYEK